MFLENKDETIIIRIDAIESVIVDKTDVNRWGIIINGICFEAFDTEEGAKERYNEFKSKISDLVYKLGGKLK